MALSAVFVAYVAAGVVVGPDWGAAARGLVVPSLPVDGDALLNVAATIGTTLAPWGLSFIQSYAVDKRLTPADLRYERVDVDTGSVLTGVVGFFVVVTSAATLHAQGTTIETAADAASALVPLAGRFAGQLFGVGLVGAALLAAAVLPLSTAYSVCEFTGHEGAVDDGYRRAPMFYGSFVLVVLIAAGAVLLPGLPLVQVLVLSQVLNTVLLVPLLVFMWRLGRDPAVMGEFTTSRGQSLAHAATIVVSGACVIALLVLTLSTA
jgi:Mn2+/Fe2+ NRAMP family transporter